MKRALTSTEEKMIDDILKYIDWDRIHTTMTHLNWGWEEPEEQIVEVPSIGRLMITARRLLVDACISNYTQAGSGGFEVVRESDKDGVTTYLRLQFVLTSWDY
jgi:hypothetical protein